MNKFYTLHVVEASYLDNWEDGQVDDTINLVDVSPVKEVFNSKEEALKFFKEKYLNADAELYFIEDDKFGYSFNGMPNDYGFEPANKDELDRWKRGLIDLYDVEYQGQIFECAAVSCENLGIH